jgi:poly(hydroxyalkanoate) depolymerase family esterase
MTKRLRTSAWVRTFQRGILALTRVAMKTSTRALVKTLRAAPNRSPTRRKAPPVDHSWTSGMAVGPGGARRYRLYTPPDVQPDAHLPLLVMLHGCGQDANSFAASTRMNRIARREGFMVLYPEQDRLANHQGCWNWFATRSGRAYAEAELIMNAIDQVCLLHQADPACVAIGGLSAGASMAALVVTRHPGRFKALVMHSGIPPGTAHSTLTALGAMHGHRPTRPLVATPLTMEADWPPLLVIHGDADKVVAPGNGLAAVQLWAHAAGARAVAARSVQRGKRYPMAVTEFKRKSRAVATLVSIDGLAHAWSGGLASKPFGDGLGPDASRMTWAFVARQLAG